MFVDILPLFMKVFDDEDYSENDELEDIFTSLKSIIEALAPLLAYQVSGPNKHTSEETAALLSKQHTLSPAVIPSFIYPDPFISRYPSFGPSAHVSIPPPNFVFDVNAFVLWIFRIICKFRTDRVNRTNNVLGEDVDVIGYDDDQNLESAQSKEDQMANFLQLSTLLWDIYGSAFIPTYTTILEPFLLHISTPTELKAQFPIQIPSTLPTFPNHEKIQQLLKEQFDIPSEEGDRITGTYCLSNAIERGREFAQDATKRYCPLFIKLADLETDITRDEPTVRNNCISALGEAAQFGGEAFLSFLLPTISVLKKELDWKDMLTRNISKSRKDQTDNADDDFEENDDRLQLKKALQKRINAKRNLLSVSKQKATLSTSIDSSDNSLLSTRKNSEEIERENVCFYSTMGAFARIFHYQTDNIQRVGGTEASSGLASFRTLWVQKLPLLSEEEDARRCHDELLRLIALNDVAVLGFGDANVASQVTSILNNTANNSQLSASPTANVHQFNIQDPQRSPIGKVLAHLFHIFVQTIGTDLISPTASEQVKHLINIIRVHLPSSFLSSEWEQLDAVSKNELKSILNT